MTEVDREIGDCGHPASAHATWLELYGSPPKKSTIQLVDFFILQTPSQRRHPVVSCCRSAVSLSLQSAYARTDPVHGGTRAATIRQPQHSPNCRVISYEFPFNERVRNLLRLEDQYQRLFFFLEHEDPRAHHAALATLFDIIDALGRSTGRADVRSELLQELERQRQSLLALREHPGVAAGVLDATLARLQGVTTALSQQAKPTDWLRQNEWLVSVRSRLVIPGGLCEFDMPSYHAWQSRPAEERFADLRGWCQPLLPLYEGLSLVLELLRQNHESAEVMAARGTYQQSPNGKPYQLLRVHLPAGTRVFPEISANKYAISIRFSSQDGQGKPQPVTHDLSFRLDLCTSL